MLGFKFQIQLPLDHHDLYYDSSFKTPVNLWIFFLIISAFLYNFHTARDVRGRDNFVYLSAPHEENRQDLSNKYYIMG